MIDACWRASSPPASSSTDADAPVRMPQKIVTGRAGLWTPRDDSMPMTSDAASAPLTKKSATSTITTSDVRPDRANCSSVVKSPISGAWATAVEMSAAPLSWRSIAAPPRIANQTKLTPLGISSTPSTNSPTVRPREMRAMNVPTKGAQEIHHAQ
jgi:hypothetical protein